MVMDEFDGAYDVYRLKTQLPYRDFKPYKTVIGYYIQLPPLLIADDVWSGLMMIKSEMALINTGMMLMGAYWLRRFFRRSAIICALLSLTAMSTYLERSSALRVDMLTAWAGFISLLFLLNKKERWSGFFAGLSFLISQKGIFYFVAGNSALLGYFLWYRREKNMLWRYCLFNLSALVPIGLYFALWGIVGSFVMTGHSTFLSHLDIALNKIYEIRFRFWAQTVLRNPLFYILTIFGLGFLLQRSISQKSFTEDTIVSYRLSPILFVYGATIFTCGLWHRQPWPYFFVILIPTFFVLVVAFFENYLAKNLSWRQFILRPVTIVLIVLGLIYPLSRIIVVMDRDNSYQQHMVKLGRALLDENEFYIAGVDILYDRMQANSYLRRLGKVRRENLRLANPEKIQKIIQDLEKVTPKFIMVNYRTNDLPHLLKNYIKRNYAQFWGSIHLYAPEIQSNIRELNLKLDGIYQVEIVEGETISLNGHKYVSNQTIFLKSGTYHFISSNAFRLFLIPEHILQVADARYEIERPFFPDVYTY
jgi:hypothetical protein